MNIAVLIISCVIATLFFALFVWATEKDNPSLGIPLFIFCVASFIVVYAAGTQIQRESSPGDNVVTVESVLNKQVVVSWAQVVNINMITYQAVSLDGKDVATPLTNLKRGDRLLYKEGKYRLINDPIINLGHK